MFQIYLGNLILKKNQYPILSNIVDLQQKVTKKYFIVLLNYMNILFEYILLILFIILKNQELYNLLRKFSNNKNIYILYKHKCLYKI